MSEIRSELIDLIKQVVSGEEIYSLPGEVTDVDEDARTCTVEPSDGSPKLFGVRLQSFQGNDDGLVLVPAMGSIVIVTFMTPESAFVSCTSSLKKVSLDTELIEVNGGSNGGMVIVQALVDKITRLESAHNALVTKYNTHTHADPTSGSTGTTSVPSSDTVAPPTSVKDLEDEKFTH